MISWKKWKVQSKGRINRFLHYGLHVLWKKGTDKATPAVIAQQLGYSAMTMTRAFDELETAGIGEHSVRGKERHLHFAKSGKPLSPFRSG